MNTAMNVSLAHKKSTIKGLIYISLRTLLWTASTIPVSYTKTTTKVTGFWDK
jgi:hypothetical protein